MSVKAIFLPWAVFNESQKLLKSAVKYFYPTFSSFWANLSLKKSFLVRSEILGLLLNRLTANYEYFCINRENLLATNSNAITWKTKKHFYCIFGIYIKFWTFWKKNEPHSLSISEVIDSKKMCLFKCIKDLVSQNPLAVNLLSNCRWY